MPVIFKKEQHGNPAKADAPKMYYPRIITLGQSVKIDTIAWKIKERSSLSNGEILSVLKNFVEVMRESLFAGQSVNMENFGIFSLSCTSEGSEAKTDCTAEKIKRVRINFRPASSVKIDTEATRAGDKIEFIDLESYLKRLKGVDGGDGDDNGGSNGGDNGGGGIIIDPNA